jgi:hypothetical protein
MNRMEMEVDPTELKPGDVVLSLSDHDIAGCHCDVRVTIVRGELESDRTINKNAVYYPANAEQDNGETYCPPMLEVAGIQVYVYVRDGKLIISADFDTMDEGYFGSDTASVKVTMSGNVVWTSS